MNFSRFNRGGMFDMMRRDGSSENLSPDAQGQNSPQPSTGASASGPTGTPTSSAGTPGSYAPPGQGQPAPPILTRPRAPALLPIKRDLVEETAISPGPGPISGMPAGAQDSITLGQLKAHTAGMEKKQKTQQYDFRYDDTDTLMNELDEFYPYVEMSHVAQNPAKFQGSFDGDWTEAPLHRRREYIEIQLEQLESPSHDVRRVAQGRLLYLLQGCFAETTEPEMQLHWVIENAKAVRAVDGVSNIVICLKDAARRYTALANDDKPPSSSGAVAGTIPAASAVDPYDDRSAELMDLLGMLYFIVEVFRSDESFGDELSEQYSPLHPSRKMVAGLKDRLPKGYPVKKVLLLMWKTLLACLGGMKEVSKARAFSRESAGLSPESKDISSWRRDTATKYPTFAPSVSSVISVPNEKLAEGIKPIPTRPNYHSTEIPPAPMRSNGQGNGSAPTSAPLPGTPAPSPPPSPVVKPKKQQYQTDPSRPFVFPYSRSSAGAPSSLVPFAISEADKLYHRHAYVSLGVYQMWEAREECMREERGLGKSGLIGFTSSQWDEEEDEEAEEAMRRDWKYEEEEVECMARGDKEGARVAREKRAAAKRLHRVEVIYKGTLPILQSCVIVLLKLLLATVTSPGTSGVNLAATLPQGLQSPTQEIPPPDAPPPTREEVDIARHREISSKAVSAIFILLLKWFKASHILKHGYLAQLLFDSNCALLVLKMFGLTDLVGVVTAKNEIEDMNFFQYCHLNCSRAPQNENRPEDDMLKAPLSQTRTSPRAPLSALDNNPNSSSGAATNVNMNGAVVPAPAPAPSNVNVADNAIAGINGGEIELIGDYSWRNFFSTINFLKILQKIIKHRSHRTYMMTTYKSSQILKRMLRVNHPMLQLQVLKLIKSQMPWCGRKWRQANMKVITSIYLNCRPELRDDWLAGTDQDTELDDALPQEYALRGLIQFYNKRHYAAHLAPLPSPDISHRRSNSTSAVMLEDPALHGQAHGQAQSHAQAGNVGQAHGQLHPRAGSMGESDVFPPRKSAVALPYNPDGMIEFWLHEYEDVLGEVFGDGEESDSHEVWNEFGLSAATLAERRNSGAAAFGVEGAPGVPGSGAMSKDRDDRAWTRLSEMMRVDDQSEEEISDSESVVSVGELGQDARLDSGFGQYQYRSQDGDGEGEDDGDGEGGRDEGEGAGEDRRDEGEAPPGPTGPRRLSLGHRRRKSGDGENTWEHMSPILALLPKSPIERRRSSSSGSGSGARPGSGSGGSPLRPLGLRTSSGSSGGSGGGADLGEDLAKLSLNLGYPRDAHGDVFEDDEGGEILGPMPIAADTKDLEEREGGAVDEVEYTYGE